MAAGGIRGSRAILKEEVHENLKGLGGILFWIINGGPLFQLKNIISLIFSGSEEEGDLPKSHK